MSDYRKEGLRITAVLVLLILSGCSTKRADWTVLVNGLPTKVSPEFASRSVVYYILRQTHEPLFRLDDGENYTSRLLKKWDRRISDGSYCLCPNTSLRFNADSKFSVDFFGKYIEATIKRRWPSAEVLQENDCFRVRFQDARGGFFDYLSQYENAPSVQDRNGFSQGLGAYRISKIDEGKIELERKNPVSNGYNRIVLYEYTAWKKSGTNAESVSDFNRISPEDIPAWAPQKYVSFANVTLKSGVLVINHPDAHLRNLIYNCVQVDVFRNAYFPTKKDFHSIKTVFPMGVPGGAAGLPAQVCDKKIKDGLKDREFVFANWREDNLKQIENFSREFHRVTGVKMRVVNSSPQTLIKKLHKFPRPFNAIVLHLDAIRAEQSAFFDVFLLKDGYLDFPLPRISEMYQDMQTKENQEDRSHIGANIAETLKNEHVVLPLYQEERTFYYPKEIKNLNVGVGFIEYPEIAEFKK